MDYKAILKDKRVWYGVAGVAVLAGFYLFMKGRTASTPDDTQSDGSGLFYTMPFDQGSTDTGTATTTGDVSTSQLLDYSNGQAQIAANQNLAAIGAQFTENLAQSLLTSSVPVAGAQGNFTVAGTPISFDFTFKNSSAAIAEPPTQHPQPSSLTTSVAA